jgi:acetyl esterase/lipase
MVAASADYRVRSRDDVSPRECVTDAKSAVRRLRGHAAELGIDPARIAAGGGSAGGHLAAATAVLDAFDPPGEDASVSCRADALVLFNPVLDLGPGTRIQQRMEDYWQEISPLHNLDSDAPPTVVFVGTDDEVTPAAAAERYRDAMTALGRRCDLHLYEGQGHGFFNHQNRRNYLLTLREADRFLVSLGWLRGEPTLEQPSGPDDRP